MTRSRWLPVFSFVTILALALGLFPTTQHSVLAQDETTLIIGHAESSDSLDPARGYTQTTSIVTRATYSTLVTFPDQDTSSIQPMLASEWSLSEDGLTYTFTLRSDVTFVSGNPLTADDVVFSLQRLQRVAGSPSFLAADIASVTAVDASTVAITLNKINGSFLSFLTNGAFSIVDSVLVTENGGSAAEDAATADQAEAFLNSTSAGTGPYILERWDPQVETVLVRNPNYWGTAPYFDRVIITNIPEAATQKIALESGDIDMALDLTSDQIGSFGSDPAFTVFTAPSLYTHFLLMNADPAIGGPMADPKVQLAVRYALDYEGYKALWGGVTPAANLAIGINGALGEDQALGRDVGQAIALLTEAGYPDGFEIELSYPDFTWQGVNLGTNAQKIQADLAEVGITVTLAPAEIQVALEDYRNGDWAFGYIFWGPDIVDSIDFLSFLPGGKVATERANWLPENADPAVIALIEQVATETDPAAYLDIFAQLQLANQQNSPFAPFNQPQLQTVYASSVQGYVFHPQWTLDVSILSRAE